MSKTLHVTLAQINPVVGDIAFNQEKILKVWKEREKATDIVIFPELVVTGYPPEDLVLKPSFIRAVEESLKEIIKASKNLRSAALISCPWRIDGKLYNAVHLIDNGEIKATRTKHHLPNYGVFDEERIFENGPLPEPVNFHGVSLGIMICEDLWIEDVSAHLKDRGAEILLIPNASPFDISKDETRIDLAKRRANETGLPLVYVNQIGGQDELVFDGGSFVTNEGGELLFAAPEFREHVETIMFEKNEGGQWLASAHDIDLSLDGEAEIYEALLLGLRDYVGKNGFPGVLLGLSGGIDSALTAVIAVDALGPESVHAVMMPSEFTSEESLQDAKALAEFLGIRYDIMPIDQTVKSVRQAIEPVSPPNTLSITFENIQSRTRGLLLMALSNASGKMLLSTGNKSEMAVGYATLYGDMNGGFNVLKDVYKTQVYALARWRNENKPLDGFGPRKDIIPERVITKVPTAELRPNQSDQDSLPPYDVLDDILQCLIEMDMGIDTITKRGHDKKLVIEVWSMLDRAEYKRRQAPPGVKITSRAFGRDRRYPMTNHFMKMIEKSAS